MTGEVQRVDEDRLIEIESKLAYQEDLLASLNDALTDQQSQLTELGKLCRSIAERLQALADAAGTDAIEDDKPPHY